MVLTEWERDRVTTGPQAISSLQGTKQNCMTISVRTPSLQWVLTRQFTNHGLCGQGHPEMGFCVWESKPSLQTQVWT